MSITALSVTDDLALENLVRGRLAQSGHAAMRTVVCSVEQGCIRLSGRTRTYYLKQLAQELARATPGAGEIENGIRVGSAIGNEG
jgi:osmotically-inducible protein OsmY